MKKDRWMARLVILAVVVALFINTVTDRTLEVEAKVVTSGYGHTAHTLTVGESYCNVCGTQQTQSSVVEISVGSAADQNI